jgi:hypothetical protein
MREIIRCLKRDVAREVFAALPRCQHWRFVSPLDKHRSIERFNLTMLEEWAHIRPYESEIERTEAAFSDFLHLSNHHCSHTALWDKPPINRVTTWRVTTPTGSAERAHEHVEAAVETDELDVAAPPAFPVVSAYSEADRPGRPVSPPAAGLAVLLVPHST